MAAGVTLSVISCSGSSLHCCDSVHYTSMAVTSGQNLPLPLPPPPPPRRPSIDITSRPFQHHHQHSRYKKKKKQAIKEIYFNYQNVMPSGVLGTGG